MTHPLTDDHICEIFNRGLPSMNDDMRAAADWQLEQVLKWLKDELDYDPHLLLDLEEAMRPQEDNQ